VSDASAIEWTQATWNPTTGCDRVSPGCDHCYALTLAKRLKAMGSAKYQVDGDPRTSGPGFALQIHPDALDLPRTWATGRRVFVNSMSDLSGGVMIFGGSFPQVKCRIHQFGCARHVWRTARPCLEQVAS
jgi:protein gp37